MDNLKKSALESLSAPALLLLASLGVGFALFFFKTVFVPLVLAFLLAVMLESVVELGQRYLKLPRSLAIASSMLILALLFLLTIMLISSALGSVSGKIPLYQEKTSQMFASLLLWLEEQGMPLSRQAIGAHLAELPVGSYILTTINSLVSSFSTLFLVLIFLAYLLAGGTRKEEAAYLKEIKQKIRSYLYGKLFLSLITGLLVGLSLQLLGLELAWLFGLLAFLLNFIPNLGSLIATLLPLPMALLQFDSPLPIILCLAIPGTIQMLVGNVLEPKLLASSLNLNPITILLSLIFWGILWGGVGMLLAVPLTAVMKIILNQSPATEGLAKLMA